MDTETIGYHGPIVLVQYQIDDDIILYNPWEKPIEETLKLYESFTNFNFIGFNVSFDWFHICQQYCVLDQVKNNNKNNSDQPLINFKDQYYQLEKEATEGPCLKPAGCIDLMLIAQKTKFQSVMDRKNIVIKNIPESIAYHIAEELENRIIFNDIYFAKKKNPKARRWQVMDSDQEGFKNLKVIFAPSRGLKALTAEITGEQTVAFEELNASSPNELGWAPFGKVTDENLERFKNPVGSWYNFLEEHIDHWKQDLPRLYAYNDVKYTKLLFEYFQENYPEVIEQDKIDRDSDLAIMVGACRWRGFTVNEERIKELIENNKKKMEDIPRSPNEVKEWIFQELSEDEKLFVTDTRKQTLEEISNWRTDDQNNHPAAIKAKKVVEARQAKKEIDDFYKLVIAGKFHPDYKIIGTKSSRMSGTGGLNGQGIRGEKEVRKCFTLKRSGEKLFGGDYDAFEVSIFDAVVKDENLHQDLLNGYKFHAIFGTYLFDETYEEIVASAKTVDDKYTKAKSGLFAVFYGGNEHTLKNRLGIDLRKGDLAIKKLMKNYPKVFKMRQRIEENYTPLRQPQGIGSRIFWIEPKNYTESLLGFKRFFDLEWYICEQLFDLAAKPPQSWKQFKGKVTRRDREQTIVGACMSALYAAAFNIQSQVFRAAANHEIQSTGAQITKVCQAAIWDLQPKGVNPWIVSTLNIHDEILTTVKEGYEDQVRERVLGKVEELRSIVPLLKLSWSEGENWEDV